MKSEQDLETIKVDIDSEKKQRVSEKNRNYRTGKKCKVLFDIAHQMDDLKAATKGKDYDALKKEYDEYKKGVEEERAKAEKEKAYKEALKDANLTEKGMEKALKYADWDKIELDEDGKLKDAKTHVKAVREEWAEYVNKQGTQGAQTPTPPTNGGGSAKLTREEIYKTDDKGRFVMDATERQPALAKLAEDE